METTEIETPDGLALAATHHTADGATNGTVLLAHGITRDMDEGGMFVRLADCLTDAGFDVGRFSFRGHGESDGSPAGVTVAGERLDFETVLDHTIEAFDGPYFAVAKSFGAVSACLSLDRFADDLSGLVLWNPVLDVAGTFLEPRVEWGRRQFTAARVRRLRETGTLELDGGFEIGRVLWDELGRYDPGARLRDAALPTLVVHGDADGIVPYEDAARVANDAGADFHTITDGDHGFVTPGASSADLMAAREQDRVTVDWLRDRVAD